MKTAQNKYVFRSRSKKAKDAVKHLNHVIDFFIEELVEHKGDYGLTIDRLRFFQSQILCTPGCERAKFPNIH